MQVKQGGANTGVPQQALDAHQLRARLEQVCGKAMTQQVIPARSRALT
jgi:hypothetical protein